MDRTPVRHGAALLRAIVFALAFAGALPAATASVAFAGTLAGVVNVNTASVEQLTLLPGIGESRAAEIVALRKQKGAFRNVESLLAVKGIGEASFNKMKPFLTLQGKTTLELK